ncbi:hypothetical protein AMS68_007572 [Peltaster fructicola]|uniref:Nephrocystin 3-like N-terminal domain-containing protein n=1 Tax=Peltaster fructicola TaxID=286661 RepID=A0A6H0Y569_9PEZI|nr:hypothetical protein AMS68_007572 [Peltaster fructicola]
MYRHYLNSKKCYVFLSDVTSHKRNHNGELRPITGSEIVQSRWFERGWTLQELLAPRSVDFFSATGECIGSRPDLAPLIAVRTGIAEDVVSGIRPVEQCTMKLRMSWVDRRDNLPEDKAYCLIGLLGISMPLVPGETGQAAMIRLREAMVRSYREDLNSPCTAAEHHTKTTSHGPDRSSDTVTEQASSSDRNQRNLLDMLKFEEMDARRRQVKKPYSNTCDWLKEHSIYQLWLNSQECKRHHGLLWIKGKPGAGKTTLVKHADDFLSPRGCLRISFYFHARGTELQRSIDGMYRSILYQLLDKQSALQDLISEKFQSFIESIQAGAGWSREVLQEMLAYAFANLGRRRVLCYVDALDECNTQQVQQMINLFETISQDCASGGRYLRILLASRHYPIVRIRTDLEMNLDELHEHQTDIEQYVNGQLDTWTDGDDFTQQDPSTETVLDGIRREIVKKAKGIFMWTVLVVEILNDEYSQGSIYNVRRRLNELPAELSQLFREVIERDAGKNIELFRRCLQWLLFSRRPLSPKEFYSAMALHGKSTHAVDHVFFRASMSDIKRFVRSSSKGLAECVDNDIPVVQFIHESVRDYLLKDEGLQEIFQQSTESMDLEAMSHEMLTRVCQVCLDVDVSEFDDLSIDDFKCKLSEAEDLQRTLSAANPLLAYSQDNVFHHANCTTDVTFQQTFLQTFDLKRWRRCSNLFNLVKTHRHPEHACLIRILARYDAHSLITIANRLGYPLHSDAAAFDALYMALAFGHKKSAKVLLAIHDISVPEHVIDALPSGRSFSAEHLMRPFVWAATKGHFSFAHILVQSETFFNRLLLQDVMFLSPINYEPSSHIGVQEAALLQLLLRAAAVSDMQFVRRLCEEQGPKALRHANGKTLLMAAAELGHIDLIDLLLSQGFPVDETDDAGLTALHWWIKGKHSLDQSLHIIANQLLSHETDCKHVRRRRSEGLRASPQVNSTKTGCNAQQKCDCLVNATDRNGCTPLMYAVWRVWSTEYVETLLAHGADIAAVDNRGRDALMEASISGTNACVSLLLQLGADINAVDLEGRTALLLAATKQYDPSFVIKVLLDHGAVVNAKDSEGNTPLASVVQHTLFGGDGVRACSHLVDHGCDIEARNRKGETPLIMSVKRVMKNRSDYNAYYMPIEMIQYLIGVGADIAAVDHDGHSAYSLALNSGIQRLMDLVVRHEALRRNESR